MWTLQGLEQDLVEVDIPRRSKASTPTQLGPLLRQCYKEPRSTGEDTDQQPRVRSSSRGEDEQETRTKTKTTPAAMSSVVANTQCALGSRMPRARTSTGATSAPTKATTKAATGCRAGAVCGWPQGLAPGRAYQQHHRHSCSHRTTATTTNRALGCGPSFRTSHGSARQVRLPRASSNDEEPPVVETRDEEGNFT